VGGRGGEVRQHTEGKGGVRGRRREGGDGRIWKEKGKGVMVCVYRVVTASPVQSSEQMATAVIWAAVMASALSLCFVMYLREAIDTQIGL
jgi:hypothetical protein